MLFRSSVIIAVLAAVVIATTAVLVVPAIVRPVWRNRNIGSAWQHWGCRVRLRVASCYRVTVRNGPGCAGAILSRAPIGPRNDSGASVTACDSILIDPCFTQQRELSCQLIVASL